MTKFLWELDIEQIPLGWIDKYNQALNQSPNGIPHLVNGEKFYVHPVKCRELLVQTFNKHKKVASELNQINNKNSKQISELLKSDIILFNVLFSWLVDGNSVEFSFFDYKTYEDESSYVEFNIYFEEDDAPFEPITYYYPYKFLSVNM